MQDSYSCAFECAVSAQRLYVCVCNSIRDEGWPSASLLDYLNWYLARWARRKYKRFHQKVNKAYCLFL